MGRCFDYKFPLLSAKYKVNYAVHTLPLESPHGEWSNKALLVIILFSFPLIRPKLNYGPKSRFIRFRVHHTAIKPAFLLLGD